MRITVPDSVFTEQVQGETVLLELESGRYYGLDPVGSRLWQLLGELGTTEAVLEAALGEYDASREELSRDLDSLVRDLAAMNLVVLDAPAVPKAD